MHFVSEEQISNSVTYPELIEGLWEAFRAGITVPDRHHHSYENPNAEKDSILLLMPAWKAGKDLGIKVVTVSPENDRYNLPAINGLYILFDASTGIPKAVMDAKALTRIRTAAASALAAKYLAQDDAKTLLMIGTGALGHELPLAHASVRNIKEIFIWGRNPEKAEKLKAFYMEKGFKVSCITKLDEAVNQADIISCATFSEEPLIHGKWLRPGQHVDLVGAFKSDGRESDDDVITRSSVFVDIRKMAVKEAGDLAIPISKGIFNETDIQADLFDLCFDRHPGRKDEHEITVFKSVGHGLEDLAAAEMIFRKLTTEH